jgi:pimeloyl-ACP methyl ester carboxylesterase
MEAPVKPQVLSLRDGRRLAWRPSGPPEGRLVLHFHGSASSRLEPVPGAEALERLGVRLVQPDRPGYGLSDAQPDRRLADWAADCEQLLDHLGASRAALSGWSAGALHALACAAHAPDRVSAVALIAMPGPLTDPALARLLPRDCRLTLALARRLPPLVRTGFALAAPVLRAHPDLSLRWFERLLPESDRRPLRDPGLRERWHAGSRESWRQGAAGAWGDGLVLTSDWDFEPARVAAPVRLWQGDADRLTPLAMAERVARELPQARLRVLPGEGHALWLLHWEEILADLLGAAGEA